MKKILLVALFSIAISLQNSAQNTAFTTGEWLQYKMSYSGFLRAGTATLELKEAEINGKKMFHAIGKGWTSGMIKWFFEVDDTYQSYFDKTTIKPYVFRRKIYEGGYQKNTNTSFNYATNLALVQDFIKQKDTLVAFKNVQDMLSSFYFLRNLDISTIKVGDEIKLDMFMDEQTYNFKLKYIGDDFVRVKNGKIKTMMFKPYVLSGRVFKAEESVIIWISADKNKIPVKLRADLRVGSLQAELESYKGLANGFEKIFD